MTALANALNDYQQFTEQTAQYPEALAIPYTALGLGDEAGELHEKIIVFRPVRAQIDGVVGEIGDVVWYLAQFLLRRGVQLGAAWDHPARQMQPAFDATLEAASSQVMIACAAIQGRVKKELRDGTVNEQAVLEYSARVLRSLDAISRALGTNLVAVVGRNRDKLLDRLERNVIKGEGDAR